VDNEKIIELLNKDLEDEHGAIIQYLTHAYGMGEGETACEIEALARDEMRHLDWLAETITELGGVPSLERGTMRMGGASVTDWMGNDVLLEEGAIAQYRQQIEEIDDPKIKRLLQRILSDELEHHQDFQHFREKADAEGMLDVRGSQSDDLISTLNEGIEHEYTVILQYLLQSYITPDIEAKRVLEDRAINEMQHLGWIAEKMIDVGGSPVIEHGEVDRSTELSDMLRTDIDIERKVADIYDQASRKYPDPKVQRLFRRMRDNEIYHIDIFNDLLEEGK
jgi:bacterioferritin